MNSSPQTPTFRKNREFLFYPDWGGLRSGYIWDSFQDEPRYWKVCDQVGLGKDQWPRKDVLLPP